MRTQKPRLLMQNLARNKFGLAGNYFVLNEVQLGKNWQGVETVAGADVSPGELWDLAYKAVEKQEASFAEPDLTRSGRCRPGNGTGLDYQAPAMPTRA